ncbi:MAG: hypothetical protein EA361_14355 [Bacteroidetes bacterium]|nr:MAG: hypothetical protein EA361_14355 [Bacteroidota bacterium]
MATVVQFIASAQGDRRPGKNKRKKGRAAEPPSLFFSPLYTCRPVISSAAKDPVIKCMLLIPNPGRHRTRGNEQQVPGPEGRKQNR